MCVESRTPNYAGLWRSLLGSSALTLIVWVGSNAIARSQAPAPPAPAATVTAPPSSPARFATLRLGSRGAGVVELQALLKLLGYYSGAIDGQFQESTATAVAAFQRAAGLEPDGVVGLNTWNQLLPTSPSVASASPIATQPEPNVTPSSSASPASPAGTPSATPDASAPSPTASPAASPTAVDLPILRLGMRGPAVVRLQERLRATGFFTGAIDGVFGAQTQAAVQAAQRRFQLQPDGVVGSATWAALLR